MTDIRKCNGPGCEEFAKLDADSRMMFEQSPERYVTVQRLTEIFHFHDYDCMDKWTAERTKK